MVEALEAVLARAIHFLGRQQDRGGAWYDFALGTGYGSCWPTAFVGFHLTSVLQGDRLFHLASAQLCRARLWLLSNQTRDGGWGFNEYLPEDADSTAMALLFFGGLKAPEFAALNRRARARIRQWENGGVGTYSRESLEQVIGVNPFFPGTIDGYQGWMSPVTSVTAAMLLCWQSGKQDDVSEVQRGVQFLLRQQRPDGEWRDYWWLQPYYPTYMAICALHSTPAAEEQIKRAVQWLQTNQSTTGGWPVDSISCNAFATALSICSLLRVSPVPWNQIEAGVRWLAEHQDPDGGFPPGAMMTIPPPDRVSVPTGIERLFDANVLDDRRLFTTAIAIRAFAEYLHIREQRSQ